MAGLDLPVAAAYLARGEDRGIVAAASLDFFEVGEGASELKMYKGSVADPFNFFTAPDPQIRFVEKRLQIRPKSFSNPFFSSKYQKNYSLMYKY